MAPPLPTHASVQPLRVFDQHCRLLSECAATNHNEKLNQVIPQWPWLATQPNTKGFRNFKIISPLFSISSGGALLAHKFQKLKILKYFLSGSSSILKALENFQVCWTLNGIKHIQKYFVGWCFRRGLQKGNQCASLNQKVLRVFLLTNFADRTIELAKMNLDTFVNIHQQI